MSTGWCVDGVVGHRQWNFIVRDDTNTQKMKILCESEHSIGGGLSITDSDGF